MSNAGKEPSIKLIPSDPMTNTILIIYCVSSTGASVPYKSSWRRVQPRRQRAEEIRHHNVSSYRCSPLDIDYFIEATVHFQHQNTQISRVVQSNVVKVSRELKEKRTANREPITARTTLNDTPLEMRIAVHEQALHLAPTDSPNEHWALSLPLTELHPETEGSQLSFRLTFRHRFEQFLSLASRIAGRALHSKTNEVVWQFSSDLSRDLVLLGMVEGSWRPQKPEGPTLQFPLNSRLLDKKGMVTARQKELQLAKNDKSPGNRSQTSVSPASGFKEKLKFVPKNVEMKRSLTNQGLNDKKKNQYCVAPTTPTPDQKKGTDKSREYLNVFEDEDLEFLNTPIAPLPPSNSKLRAPEAETGNDGPSINLRGSFEQLEKSFNSNLNQETLDRVFGEEGFESRKLQQEVERLRRENESLKKQVETISQLTKENNSIKRKYLEMKEQVNRLQMERKVILTDKLRCQVNWHREIQEKEALKKELEHLRDHSKASPLDRSMRVVTSSDLAYDRQEVPPPRPANTSFYR